MKLEDARGDWALVTGASEGIGREFCRHLAAAGVNLAMVARRLELEELARELSQTLGVQTLALHADLGEPGAAERVAGEITRSRLRLRLLCNVAAAGRLERFGERPAEEIERDLALNVRAAVLLCALLLPELEHNRPSAVINVSSPAALQPMPGYAVYAATKAFLHSFSQALYGEWQERGIYVQTLVPAPAATDFDRKAGASHLKVGKRVAPAEIVKLSLAHLDGDRPIVTNAKGLLKQRLFAALAPARTVIRTVDRMVRPPKR